MYLNLFTCLPQNFNYDVTNNVNRGSLRSWLLAHTLTFNFFHLHLLDKCGERTQINTSCVNHIYWLSQTYSLQRVSLHFYFFYVILEAILSGFDTPTQNYFSVKHTLYKLILLKGIEGKSISFSIALSFFCTEIITESIVD